MLLEKLARIFGAVDYNTEVGNLNRREFLISAAVSAGAYALPLRTVEASQQGDKDLAARIRTFRKTPTYPSIHEYADSLNIGPLTAGADISTFLTRKDTVAYIKQLSTRDHIPSYLLAAIIAEERTSVDPINGKFHKTGENIKSRLGYDTTIGKANVKMSRGAYKLGKMRRQSQQEFDALNTEEKEEVRRYLENDKNNLMVASDFVRDLKRKFLWWNERYMGKKEKITSEEADFNPVALLQIANGYSGGEDLLDSRPSDKAKRVISMLIGNPFIFELYDGNRYNQRLQQLKAEKGLDSLYKSKLMKVQEFLTAGIELRDKTDFDSGYNSLVSAIKAASDGVKDVKSKSAEWEITFLSYEAYANAAAAYLLVTARNHGKKSKDDKKKALDHYQSTLNIYKILEGRKIDLGSIRIRPKPTWDKSLPSKKDINDVMEKIRQWI